EAKSAAQIIEKLASRPAGPNTVYNINIPAGKTRGVVTATTELMPYTDRYDRRVDPRGRVYYWLRGEPPRQTKGNGHLTDAAGAGPGGGAGERRRGRGVGRGAAPALGGTSAGPDELERANARLQKTAAAPFLPSR